MAEGPPTAIDLARELRACTITFMRAHVGVTPREAIAAARILETDMRLAAGVRVNNGNRGREITR